MEATASVPDAGSKAIWHDKLEGESSSINFTNYSDKDFEVLASEFVLINVW